jgi:hypothetical protein
MAIKYLIHIRNWWKDPYRNRPNWSEKVSVLLTIVVVLVAAAQLRIYQQQKAIMESSGKQTQQLIEAANIQAGAATKNAAAAASFSDSAKGINTQTALAVGDFQRMAEAAGKQATAAGKQADTSLGSLKVNQNISRAWQRPYISAKAVLADDGNIINGSRPPFLWNIGNGCRVQIDMEFVNIGTTPAQNVSATQPYFIVDENRTATIIAQRFNHWAQPTSATIDGGGIIAPRDPQTLPPIQRPVLTQEQCRQVMASEHTLYIVGAIKYTDVFKPVILPYVTTYCYRYVPGTYVSLRACPFGNSIN